MSEHSKYFSPSSIGRRILCGGSAYLEADLPDASGPAAAYGTGCHLIMEKVVAEGHAPKDYLSKEIIPGVVCDQNMVDLCDIAKECIERVIALTDGVVSTEVKLSLDWAGCPDVHGTADVKVEELFGTLWIVDYKFGQVSVSPDTPQLKTYAYLAAGEELASFENIRTVIIQPASGEPLKEHTMAPDDLQQWADEILIPTVKLIESGEAPRVPSDEACKYCKATSICPEFNALALATAQADFKGELTSPEITPALVNTIYPQLALLEKWIGLVKDKAYEMAGNGALIGYKLVQGRNTRTWTDPQAAEDFFARKGIDPYERKLISPAKADKVNKEIKEAIKAMVTNVTGAPSIAPISSPKKQLETAADDFKNLQN